MARCEYCKNKIREYPRPCSYCQKFFCKKHRLPENHNCEKIQMISKQRKNEFKKEITNYLYQPKQKSNQREEQKNIKSSVSNLRKWLNTTSHHHNSKRFLKNFGMMTIYGLILHIIYLNIDELNKIKIIIPLGGALLLIFTIMFVTKTFKSLTLFQEFYNSLRNWQKIAVILLIFLIIGFGILNQEQLKNKVYEKINDFSIQKIFPLTITEEGNEKELFSGEGQRALDKKITTASEKIAGKPLLDFKEIEYKIHELVNEERMKNGLNPLLFDTELRKVAESHSIDMSKNGYFAHENLKGQTPTDRANSAKYSCFKDFGTYYTEGIAENIFQNNLYDSVTYIYGVPVYEWNDEEELAKTTVVGWMNSPGHRKNILTENYDREGIGLAVSEDDKVYITQNFC